MVAEMGYAGDAVAAQLIEKSGDLSNVKFAKEKKLFG